jgi:ribonuclease HI
MKNEVIIYTDGACKGNPGIGGWGAVLKYKDKNKKIYGYQDNTTNNRMELTAAIKALDILKEKSQVVLYTDSKYVMNGITLWIDGWKKNHWKTSSKKIVKNIDLWKLVDSLNSFHIVEWKWVKGHSGNTGNEIADELANLAILEYGEKK